MIEETIQPKEQATEGSRLSNAKRKLLEKFLKRPGGVELNARAPIPRRAASNSIPLSFAQRQVWVHAQMAGDVPIYNEAVTIYRHGPLDVAVLEQCMVEMIARHEIWRTTFGEPSGDVVQTVHDAPKRFALPLTDVRYLAPEQRSAEALRLATEDARRPFDLKNGPLVRGIVVRTDEQELRLCLTFHQIVFDAVTAYRVLMTELPALYGAFSSGKSSPLPEPALQFGDFAAWERANRADAVWDAQLAFWRQKLSGELPVLAWPNEHPRAAQAGHRGAVERFHFAPQLIPPLRAFCLQQGVSSYMALVASFTALLGRYTGQDDIVIGGISGGRRKAELEPLAGYFVNPFALRVDLSGDPTFRELTKRVMSVVLDALANEEVPFAKVIEDLRLRSEDGRNPAFQIALSQQPQLSSVTPGWNLATEEVSNGGAKMDLVMVIDERLDAISGPISYNCDLFEASTVKSMVDHWQTLLAAALADPDRKISQLPLLRSEEERLVVGEWNNTGAAYARDAMVHEAIEAQAALRPDAAAVKFGEDSLTYRELNERANHLAHYLRRLGVRADELVGVCVERTLRMPVALLGVLKAGGAYLPLDPSYPRERLAFMAQDSGIRVLVTEQALELTWRDLPVRPVSMDRDWPAIANEPTENPPVVGDAESLAYVIYTSGSTGKPKGVQIPHRALMNLIRSVTQHDPGMNESDTIIGLTTISFDIAAVELIVPLSVGARIVLVGRDTATDPEALAACAATQGVTIMQATPATWRMLIHWGWRGKAGLRIICTGEALSKELAEQLLQRGAELWNGYGPTETTIWSTIERIKPNDDAVLIGRPLANTQIYVLDKNLRPVPLGIAGELYIGGDGLARGYLNRPDLTAERFVANPFRPGARMYKTGDLARFRSDGRIECLGRVDRQVKIRGHRIELDEVEAALRGHHSVREAVVIVREDKPGERNLVGYVVMDGARDSLRDVRDCLKQKLPAYMIPELVNLERLPLTPNGKLDRKALPAPEAAAAEGSAEQPDAEFGEPQDEIEKLLAELWREELHVDRISVYDNFFDLGGHSLSAIQVLMRLQKRLGVRMKPNEVAFQSLGQLAAVCRERVQRQ